MYSTDPDPATVSAKTLRTRTTLLVFGSLQDVARCGREPAFSLRYHRVRWGRTQASQTRREAMYDGEDVSGVDK